MTSTPGHKVNARQQSANLLLLNNLLSCQPGASPFTLVLDSINQPAKDLISRYIYHAAIYKTPIIFLSFESYPLPKDITVSVKGRRKDPNIIREAIITAFKQVQSKSKSYSPPTAHLHTALKILLIIDSLHALCSIPPPFSVAAYLFSLLSLSPNLSLVAVYHTDVPLPSTRFNMTQSPPRGRSTSSDYAVAPILYAPSPLTLLTYLSTTILTTLALAEILAKKAAQDRSFAEPVFGIEEETDGLLTALCAQPDTTDGRDQSFVLVMEHRRKSGRTGGITKFYMPPLSNSSKMESQKPMMLDDHPLFRPKHARSETAEGGEKSTFDLTLTDKQKRAREGVVLPYFDAQKVNGSSNEGGKILYDMGVEDDFDEEEDEI